MVGRLHVRTGGLHVRVGRLHARSGRLHVQVGGLHARSGHKNQPRCVAESLEMAMLRPRTPPRPMPSYVRLPAAEKLDLIHRALTALALDDAMLARIAVRPDEPTPRWGRFRPRNATPGR